MTDYINLLETNVSIDSPESQILNQALRDNILAINEGAAGAPRYQPAAFSGHTNGDFEVAGDIVLTTQNYITGDITWMRSGTFRILLRVTSSSATGNYATFTVNGDVVLTTATVGASSSADITGDIELNSGDVISCERYTAGITFGLIAQFWVGVGINSSLIRVKTEYFDTLDGGILHGNDLTAV